MPDLSTVLEWERRVWQALLTGDAKADAACLSADFLGVYPSGFSDRAGHAAQLADGPTMLGYEIAQARLTTLAPDTVLLAYLARYEPAAHPGIWQAMYISSIWQRRGDDWLNVFSQDTPTAP